MDKNQIPVYLQNKNIWCNYKMIEKNGNITKIPFQPNGENAKTNDKATWSSLNSVLTVMNRFDGIGLFFTENICGIDIDHCIDEQGNFSELAKDIIDTMNKAYIEYSPSGTGIHIIFLASPLQNKNTFYTKNSNIGLEIYSASSPRYFTFTGNCINNPIKFEDLTKEVQAIQRKYMKRNTNNTLELAFKKDSKLNALWNKQATGAGGTESEDDMALCAKLSYYLNGDSTKIKEAFLSSPYFLSKDDEHKKKCLEREDYLDNTISKVINVSVNANKKAPQEIKPLVTISANALQLKEIPELKCIVDNLIYQGLTTISSQPKMGKSWLSLDLCLSVAKGTQFLIFDTNKTTCLYLALEDSERRLKNRLNTLLNGEQAPDNFFFATESYKMDSGLLEQLKIEIEKHPDIGLIVIDTLQKVRKMNKSSTSVYADDYDEISSIKKFADNNHIAIVLIHHNRKENYTSDPFLNMSGSNGISGSADTMIVITKEKRESKEAKFSVTGRDVLAVDLIIYFDENSCKWNYVSSQEERKQQLSHQEYVNSPITKVIKQLLKDNNSVSLNASGIIEKIQDLLISDYDESPNNVSRIIKKYTPFFNLDDIYVEYPNKNGGTKGRLFHFYVTDNADNS